MPYMRLPLMPLTENVHGTFVLILGVSLVGECVLRSDFGLLLGYTVNNGGPIKKWFWAASRSYTQQGYNFGMFETRG